MPAKLIALALAACAAFAAVVTDVQTAMSQNNFPLAEAILESYRTQRGVTPEYLEALSWLARGDLATRQFDKAGASAQQTERLAIQSLATRPLDAEPHLPLALGAAIEVEAQVMAANGDRAQALALRGKPVLLFFWAHWCPDCKQEEHILAQIADEYRAKGLVMIAPTQRYGYAANGDEASPADELKYIEQIRRKYYADLLSVPAPVSQANFHNYGASTTPTLVLIDRRGIVRLYHPGAMTLDELRAALNHAG